LPSNSLFVDSVARLVRAAAVEEELAAVLGGVKRLGRFEAWPLPTLPIDIIISTTTAGI
jgi:hypothetical protein